MSSPQFFPQNEPDIDPQMLAKWNCSIPRYTSYPTAVEWNNLTNATYLAHLQRFDQSKRNVSIYFHIPFCSSMCLYCGCSVILNRKPEKQQVYVEYLKKEMALLAAHMKHRHTIVQLHFGGGTPTLLTEEQFDEILTTLQKYFDIDFNSEVAIEIDPRTVFGDKGKKLQHLRKIGFNRVSFGVQDTNQEVQDAVHRRQSYEMTAQTYAMARQLQFHGINVDLIYGLPKQTPQSFVDTVEKISELRPDRIALFSYAKIPWLKPHQKAIKEEQLPSTENKFQIYVQARKHFLSKGYVALGMDHFGLPHDELTQAYLQGNLQRNFHGYTLKLAENMISFGVTSIGEVEDAYFQNVKTLDEYYAALDHNTLPVAKGLELTPEDLLRRWVIKSLMCNFELDKQAFEQRFQVMFDVHFAAEQKAIAQLQEDGLLTNTAEKLQTTFYGKLFIRNIACIFDAYTQKRQQAQNTFSKSI